MSIRAQRGKRYRFTVEAYAYEVAEGRVDLCTKNPQVTFDPEGEEQGTVYGPQGEMGYLTGRMLAEDPVEISTYEPGSIWLYGAEDKRQLVVQYSPVTEGDPWLLMNSEPAVRFAEERIEHRYLTPLTEVPVQNPSA